MLCTLYQRLRTFLLRRRHRRAMERIQAIESLRLPEDLQKAAVRRVMRQFEQRLDRYTRIR